MAFAAVLAAARPATADLVVFRGAAKGDSGRTVNGVGLGLSAGLVGLEFEYARTRGTDAPNTPALQTGIATLLVQAPLRWGIRVYGAAGGGLYQVPQGETADIGFLISGGGGMSLPLLRPVRLRLDYRHLRLGRSAGRPAPHRVTLGLILPF